MPTIAELPSLHPGMMVRSADRGSACTQRPVWGMCAQWKAVPANQSGRPFNARAAARATVYYKCAVPSATVDNATRAR